MIFRYRLKAACKGAGMKGLPNAGQTCYLNAALQCLVYCPNITNYFLGNHEPDALNPKKKLASALATEYAAFVRAYWTIDPQIHTADPSAVRAAFVKACRGFAADQQHDAHEALVCLLDKLHDGLSKLKPGDLAVAATTTVRAKPWTDALKNTSSVVSEVFRGQIETTVTAPGYTSLAYDHFTCLSLAITNCSSLKQCLQHHMANESLDAYKVDDSTTVAASLQKRFTYLPRVLAVHLKRFDGDGKIGRFVDYPAELDLGEYTVPECPHHYALFGVCLHHGSAHDGHYSAMCEVHDTWYVMDDDSVMPLDDINNIIQKDAYVLLYKRL